MMKKLFSKKLKVLFSYLLSLLVWIIILAVAFLKRLDFIEGLAFLLLACLSYLFFILIPFRLFRFFYLKRQANIVRQQKITPKVYLALLILLAVLWGCLASGGLAYLWQTDCQQRVDSQCQGLCYSKIYLNPTLSTNFIDRQCRPLLFKINFTEQLSGFLAVAGGMGLMIILPLLLGYRAILEIRLYKTLRIKKKLFLGISLLIFSILWLLLDLFLSLALLIPYCNSRGQLSCQNSIVCNISQRYGNCEPFYGGLLNKIINR